MNYKVGDFIIRIKNAALSKRKKVVLDFSNMNRALADTLVKNRFLEEVKEEVVEGKKKLIASIRYENRKPVLTDVILVSKPSIRVYKKSFDTKAIERRRRVITIFSTNKGIMTGEEARKQKVGGELLFMIW